MKPNRINAGHLKMKSHRSLVYTATQTQAKFYAHIHNSHAFKNHTNKLLLFPLAIHPFSAYRYVHGNDTACSSNSQISGIQYALHTTFTNTKSFDSVA